MGVASTISNLWSAITQGKFPVSRVFPLYEQTTPAYPQPTPRTLMEYYRADVLAYACMTARADAISEAPLITFDSKKK